MSGRRSAVVEYAVTNVLAEWKALRHAKVRLTPGIKRQIIKDQAVASGIHKVTLFRALGYYKDTNGSKPGIVGRRARRSKRPSA